MALQTDITKFGTTFSNAYVRITNVGYNKIADGSVVVRYNYVVLPDSQSSEKLDRGMKTFNVSSVTDLLTECYDDLKTIFTTATDV